jgi:hypothetical protein
VLHDKVNGVQGAVFKGNEKMDQFKLQMNWNQEELEQWALAARQKEEDNLALLKYTKVRAAVATMGPSWRHSWPSVCCCCALTLVRRPRPALCAGVRLMRRR